ncbi:leucine-rich repeat-containing protein 57-like [Artemia franciscana]|uniref:leucine-rich repeat-containing protein 57-like n=1 Tax=Artemia franciscana TaxID=6661 RepID=UPI0032DB04B3
MPLREPALVRAAANHGMKRTLEPEDSGCEKITWSDTEIKVPEELQSLAKSLRNLDLSNNKLALLPDYLSHFSSLKLLKLEHNRLSTLPVGIGDISKLETISLQDNSLTSLPASFVNLKNLKSLNLSGNRFSSLSVQLFKLGKLDVLDISRNKISEIPDGIEELQVSEMCLMQNQVSKISKGIAKCPRLKVLRLEENCLTLEAIPVELLKESSVSLLSLEGNLFEMKVFSDVEGY